MRGLLACVLVPCAASLVMAANVARTAGAPPIALASDEGQKLLAECGSTLAYDAVWPHWTKQVGKTCCAPCTLAMVCNALGVDKRWGRDIERWETVEPSGPHRPDGPWDEDDVLARSTDPAAARESGCTLQECADLAGRTRLHCLGASPVNAETAACVLEESLYGSLSGADEVVVANYDMTVAGQAPFGGHFSPVVAHHAASDRYLVLDCWPETEPSWLHGPDFAKAIAAVDAVSGRSRGILTLSKFSELKEPAAPSPGLFGNCKS